MTALLVFVVWVGTAAMVGLVVGRWIARADEAKSRQLHGDEGRDLIEAHRRHPSAQATCPDHLPREWWA